MNMQEVILGVTGVKGAGGPVPKKSNQKHGHRTKAELEAKAPTKAVDPHEVEIPAADEDWHPVAKLWFNSLERSGQSAFYANSDWGAAFLLAESISREMKPQVVGNTKDGEPVWASIPPKAASVAAWLKGMTALLATEGDRRRAAVELQRPKPQGDEGGGDVSEIDDWRRRLRGSG